jgi:hypothetical protein
MGGRTARTVVLVVVALAVAVGLVALGRVTAGTGAARADGVKQGRAAGYAAGYADGVHEGRAAGVAEGRALQVPLGLPSGTGDVATAAFGAGYTAGANDVFDGYDGGWGLDEPYVIVLAPAGNGITYRIVSRTPMRDGVDYRLCPHSTTLCQQPR